MIKGQIRLAALPQAEDHSKIERNCLLITMSLIIGALIVINYFNKYDSPSHQ